MYGKGGKQQIYIYLCVKRGIIIIVARIEIIFISIRSQMHILHHFSVEHLTCQVFSQWFYIKLLKCEIFQLSNEVCKFKRVQTAFQFLVAVFEIKNKL